MAVGDVASTSQLPSPHGGHSTTAPPASTPPPPAFTAADFIRSVNKKVLFSDNSIHPVTPFDRILTRLSANLFPVANAMRFDKEHTAYYPTSIFIAQPNLLKMP